MTTDQAKQALEQIRAGFEALGFPTRDGQFGRRGFQIVSGDGCAFGVGVYQEIGACRAVVDMIAEREEGPIHVEMSVLRRTQCAG